MWVLEIEKSGFVEQKQIFSYQKGSVVNELYGGLCLVE